jgi:virginiamycin B lyase
MRLATLALVLVAVPLAAQTADRPSLREWTVPWERTRPRDPALDAQGRVWFVGQEGNYVAYLEPTKGTFKRFTIDSGAFPHTVTIDARGFAWYAGNRNGTIVRVDPATGALTRYPMPDPTVRDPHTMAFDQQGVLWFTAQQSNAVGRLDPRSGKIDLVKITTPGARPYGIVINRQGRPFFNLFGTNKLGTIDPVTMQVREYILPDGRARGRRIALTSDGMIWYGDYSRGFLGRLDPVSGVVKEWQLPGGAGSLPYALTSDDDDRLWLVETGKQPNRFVGFDPRTEQFFGMSEVASGGGTIRHMIYDKATRTIWFGTDNGTIGKAVVPKRATPVSE